MSTSAHATHPRHDDLNRLEREHHLDREGLVAQLRALAAAIEHLSEAVKVVADEDDERAAVLHGHVEDARAALRSIW